VPIVNETYTTNGDHTISGAILHISFLQDVMLKKHDQVTGYLVFT
jgi:hypothetical protein